MRRTLAAFVAAASLLLYAAPTRADVPELAHLALVAPGPMLAQAQGAPAAALDAPDVGAWLTDTFGAKAAKWIALLGVIALFTTWLLTTVNGLEALFIRFGWWDGKRRGVWLVIYTVLHFLAQNLSRFFPSRAGQLRNAAPSSPR